MRITSKIFYCSFVNALLVLTFLSSAQAQTKKTKHPRWNWEKHQVKTINYAKKYLVSDIEEHVPQISFEKWLQQIVGEKAKIDWEVNDCGEQTGTSADKRRDLPMCVEANAVKNGSIYISVNIQIGTFGRGITKMKPVVRSLTVGDEIGGNWLDRLSDLPEYLVGSDKKNEYPNPTNGIFKLSGIQPAGFENIDGILIRTMDYDGKEKNTYIGTTAGIQVAKIYYGMKGFIVENENVYFETQKINDVSFKFLGKLEKLKFSADGTMLGDKLLSGHLTKFINDKKTAEADLVFDFVLKNPCKGCGQPPNRKNQ